VFEELVSEEWKGYAFTKGYMVARWSFTQARHGLGGKEGIEEVRRMVKVWQELQFDERIGREYIINKILLPIQEYSRSGDGE
jgi:hypothetical protein